MKFFSTFFYLIFGLIIIPQHLISQTYNIKNFNVENGLAQSQAMSLFQDKLGNLWIGTNGGGVSIYNGKEFKTLSKENGLVNNVVYSITEDENGNKYIGTNEGLSIYNGINFQNYTIKEGLPSNRTYNIAIDEEKRIWIGTSKGLATFENNKIVPYFKNDILNKSEVYTIFIDSKKTIWFGTLGNGIVKYANNEFEHLYSFDESLTVESKKESQNNIRTITEDSNGNILFGTLDGILLYSYKTNKLKVVFYQDDKHSLTFTGLATINDEINAVRYDGKFYKLLNYKDTVFNILTWLQVGKIQAYTSIRDVENNIWIGSNAGLYRISPQTFINYNESDSLHNNSVYAICKTHNNDFYIGCSKRAVAKMEYVKYDKVKFTKFSYDNTNHLLLNGSVIFSIIEDKNNNVCIATNNGFTRYNDKGLFNYTISQDIDVPIKTLKHLIGYTPNLPSRELRSLLMDSSDTVWIGTSNGVGQYKDDVFWNFNTRFKELEEQWIWKIFEDSYKNIWFCTNNGVFVYDRRTLKHLGKAEGFTDERVVSMTQDVRGNYWFGTKQGIYRFDDNFFNKIEKPKSDLISTSNGISSNNIYLVILDDNNNLFIGTDKGIDKLDTKTYNSKREIKVKNYSEIDGFIGQECNLNACYKDDNGKIYFGTVKGVTVYNPLYDKFNFIKPITQISNIQLTYRQFDWTPYSNGIDSLTKLPKNLVLPYNKNHLTFEFVAASLAIPEKVKYQYKLEGLSEDWSPPRTKSEADFPSLPDGDYVFKVKACNNDGVWSDVPTEFRFTIKPPFWKTWWFYTVLTILTLILFFLYVKWREAKLKRDKAVLEQTVLERTEEVVKQKELVEQKNKDITDSINYARNIQEAVLVNITEIKKCFSESFVLFRPRDIVSGDFYWFSHRGEFAYIAAADCTGHGVPGAFMSMLGMAFLNEIVNNNDHVTPNEVLNSLRENVIHSLHQTGKAGESKDGMDLALAMINLNNNEMQFAGANNPIYIVRNKENYFAEEIENSECRIQITEDENAILLDIKPDKMPIGYYIKDNLFTNNIIQLKPTDRIYLFSDGYADQFGGDKCKKFKYTQLKDILIQTYYMDMDNQKEYLDKTMIEWRGEQEQIDDILVVGVSIF